MGKVGYLIYDITLDIIDAMSVLERKSYPNRPRRGQASSPRKSELTRQVILEAALEILWTHPFRDVTVADVMARAGSSRSTFYQYFSDLHDMMETLLEGMRNDVMAAASPWLTGEGNQAALLRESLVGIMHICYSQGPIMRAIVDAAAFDARLERAWDGFLNDFDDAVTKKIEQQQTAGLVANFPARPIAVAFNRLDVAMVVEHFGQRPPGNPDHVGETLTRIWVTTLYGAQVLQQLGDLPERRDNLRETADQNWRKMIP